MSILSPLFTWRSAIVDSELPATVRHVALTLSLHMNERGGSAFPAIRTLGRETGRGTSTVTAALRTLEAAGWLLVERGGGRGHPNRYTATVPEPPDDGHVPAPKPPGDRNVPTVETFLSASINVPATGTEDVNRTERTNVLSCAPSGARQSDPVFDALAAVCGYSPDEARGNGRVGKAAAMIRKAGGTAEEVIRRADVYRRRWPTVTLTPTGLANNWPVLRPNPVPTAPAGEAPGVPVEPCWRCGTVTELREEWRYSCRACHETEAA